MNEQKIIGHVTRALHRGTREMDGATAARLSALRHQALSHAAAAHIRAGAGILTWVQRHTWVAGLVVVFVLFAGWNHARQQKVAPNVETDLLLLTGELPPSVYADGVFAPWLQGYRR